MDNRKIRFIDDRIFGNSVDKEGCDYDDWDDEFNCEKNYKHYVSKMKNLTRRNTSVVLSYYTSFIVQFPDGRMNRDEFLKKVVDDLVVQAEQGELISNKIKEERTQICSHFFDICDKNADGKVDLIEYFTLFWSRSEGSTYEKLTLIFEMFDLNNNGWIDFNELHTIVKTLLKLKYAIVDDEVNKKEIEDQFLEFQQHVFKDSVITNAKLPLSYNIAMYIMRKLDISHNARLTKSEFVEGCLESENIRKFLSPLNTVM